MRIFIDSNILVSALVFNGNEIDIILRALRRGRELVISEHVEEEVFRTLLEKFPEHAGLFHEFLSLGNIKIIPKERYMGTLDAFDMVRDKHDRHVLACAVIANCEIIVTGDKDLLTLKKCKGVEIFTAKGASNRV